MDPVAVTTGFRSFFLFEFVCLHTFTPGPGASTIANLPCTGGKDAYPDHLTAPASSLAGDFGSVNTRRRGIAGNCLLRIARSATDRLHSKLKFMF
jgi:hypothetical protein